MYLSRRRFLWLAASSGALAAVDPVRLSAAWAESSESEQLIVRVSRPLDAETPVAVFRDWLTPNDRFFVRSHFGPPSPDAVAPEVWRLKIDGLVERPCVLMLDDLRQFERVEVTAVLQCSGNGRAFYRPGTPGVQWERGAVGNARWTGVRMRDVLAAAGLSVAAAHVELLGVDRPLFPSVPLFRRSIPLAKALHPDTLLAYAMNGEPLPLLHGAPLRVITPGWMGDSSVKWLTQITLRRDETAGYYMEIAYRYPRRPVSPGEPMPPRDTDPVTTMVVKSLITAPNSGAVLSTSEIPVQGVAWTGEARITGVEVSVDRGERWVPAVLDGPDERYGWRQWRAVVRTVERGPCEVWSRATDDRGATQPVISPWNPGGFLWNGVDRVPVEVRRV